MASGGGASGTLASVSATGDGVANESSSPAAAATLLVVPDWKRELIERRKSLTKTSTSPTTTGHSHSQRSKEQSASPVSALRSSSSLSSASNATTTDSHRSHTPVTGTQASGSGCNNKLDFSAGKSFDQVTSPSAVTVAFARPPTIRSPRISQGVANYESCGEELQCSPGSDTSKPVCPVGQQQKNNHNTNCAGDNNNQKRNTDDAERQQQPQLGVRSASFSTPASASSSPPPPLLIGGAVKNSEFKRSSATTTASVGDKVKDSAKSHHTPRGTTGEVLSKMVAQEVCESAAMDAALAIGGSVVMGQCNSPDGGSRQDFETSEELKYGPGIVQKLRSRFMSYTMRLNAAKNQRPSLQNMRRATSLNNLLDDDEESTRTASPVHSATGGGGGGSITRNGTRCLRTKETGEDVDGEIIAHRHSMGSTNGHGQNEDLQCDGLKKYQNEMMRSRQLRRGNDSLKRARSVETLRYDSKAWERDVQMTNSHVLEAIVDDKQTKDVNMEDRIVKAREKGDPRPTRLKPFIDATERPPPDLVKTTLMKFEATANRRGRAPSTRNGEVAAKVAILEKPAILHPKPPLSPKKPTIKPRSSVQPQSPLVQPKQQQTMRSPSPLLIQVDMSYKQSTPATAAPALRNGSNLLPAGSSPQTPPDLINSVQVGRAQPNHNYQHPLQHLQTQNSGGGGYESPITQLTNKLKSMQLQSPVVVGGGGAKRLIDNTSSGVGIVGGGAGSRSTAGSSSSSASTATSSATSSPVPHSAASGSYYLNGGSGGGSSAAGRLELGDVSAEECYEYRDYDEDEEESYEEEGENEEDETGEKRVNGRHFESAVDHDEELDEAASDNDNERVVRRINKAELQNIGQAGTTQEFRFNSSATNGSSKSHLPVAPPRTVRAKGTGQNMRFLPSAGIGGGGGAANLGVDLKKIKGQSSVQDIVLDEDGCKTTTALLIKQIKEEARKCGQVNGGGAVNSVVSVKSGSNGAPEQASYGARNGNSDTSTNSSRQQEIEKNLINVGKSEGAKEQQQQTESVVMPAVAKKKSWQEEPQGNTMVFNFSQRKDVPDYIDSDVMIMLPNRKRELPKPGESGFVVLGDLSLETSTDPDDAWTMGPPSPCNILFENDNIIIDGKSNLRKQLNRSKQWSIRFDDSLTCTFEYVSESSFLETYDDDVDSSSDSQLSMNSGHKFMTINSAPLGSYTPVKGSVDSNFELGVTKSPSPGGGSSSVSKSPSPTQNQNGDALTNGDPESLQYLKPATDEETVAWSEGTRATDLLF